MFEPFGDRVDQIGEERSKARISRREAEENFADMGVQILDETSICIVRGPSHARAAMHVRSMPLTK